MSRNTQIKMTIDGTDYEGSYEVERGLVTVSYLWHTKTTQVGASAEATARMLLRELVAESKD